MEDMKKALNEEQLEEVSGGALSRATLPKYKVDQELAILPHVDGCAYPQPAVVLKMTFDLFRGGWQYKVRKRLIGDIITCRESELVPIEEAPNYMP